MRVRIMRGPPGSGKTHFGSKILSRILGLATVVSADDFFVGEDGIYRFDVSKLAAAHKECRRKFLLTIISMDKKECEASLLVVDNTNTMPTEIAFYYDLATLYTDDVEILTMEPPAIMDREDWLSQCCAKNQHGVPMKSINAMADRMKKYKLPWYWREKMVTREEGYFLLNGRKHEV